MMKIKTNFTLREIDYAMLFREIPQSPLKEAIAALPPTGADFENFFATADAATDLVYEKAREQMRDWVVYPDLNGDDPLAGAIGLQTGSHHIETLAEHVGLVCFELIANQQMSRRHAAILAVLHDIGKKYTTAINKKRHCCFYGHDRLSAYLAAHWLERYGGRYDIEPQLAQWMVAAIWGHMLPRDEDWEHCPEKRTQFADMLANHFCHNYEAVRTTVDFTEVLSKADAGCRNYQEYQGQLSCIAAGWGAIKKALN